MFKALLFLFSGMLLCLIAKYSDTVPANGFFGNIWSLISDITTRLGIWVLLAAIIAAWRHSPRIGAIKVFAFLIGMLLTYYDYSMLLFSFFPGYYFIRWGVLALASPIAAYIVWFGMGNGWIAAFCAAMPISLFISMGYFFFYTFNLADGFDILSAVILFLILPINKKQWFKIVPFTFLIVWIHMLCHTCSEVCK